MTGFICAVIDSARRWRRNRAQRSYFGKEITLFLKLIAHTARALFEHRNVYISFALDGQQLQLLLLAQGIVLESHVNMRTVRPFQTNIDFILLRIESDVGIFKLGGQIAFGNQCLANAVHIFSEHVPRERRPGLKLQSWFHGADYVKSRDRERADVRLFARRDRIDDNPPSAGRVRWIGFFGVLDRGFVITSIAQISLNLICVAFNCLQRKSAAGLK